MSLIVRHLHPPNFLPPPLRSWLALLALSFCVVTAPLHAQPLPSLPGMATPAAKEPAAAAPLPSTQDWAARLAQARADHDRVLGLPPGAPLLDERQVASARRLALLGVLAEVNRTGLPAAASPAASAAPAVTLRGDAPFDLLEVDRLRDQLLGLTAQQSALRLSLKSLENDLDSAAKTRSAADAALRLRRERADRPGIGADREDLRAQVELAELQAQVAELELLQADAARESTRIRLAALTEPIASIEGELGRVQGRMKFDAASLNRVLQQSAAQRQALAAERARLAALLESTTRATPDAAASLEREVRIRSVVALDELDGLERLKAAIWRDRYELVAAKAIGKKPDLSVAESALALRKLAERERSVAARGEVLRDELRAQDETLQGQAAGTPERAAAARVHEALAFEYALNQRLGDAIGRARLLLERLLRDQGIEADDHLTSWLRAAPALAGHALVSAWNYELFSATEDVRVDGRVVTVDHGVTVGKSIGVLLMLVAGFWLAKRLSYMLVQRISRRLRLSTHLERVIRRWISSVLLLVVVLLVLKTARIPLTVFAFLGGALAIGVGFGAQNVIKNLISGVIILFERKIRVGDIISVGGMSGTVLNVDLRATTVRGGDGIDAIVPNSLLLENQISNWSGGNPTVRRGFVIGVAYGTDMRMAAQLVTDCALAQAAVLKEPPPEVLFDDFGADACVLRLQYWIALHGERGGAAVDSDLRYAIQDAFGAAGIEMPVPRRTVLRDAAQPMHVEPAERNAAPRGTPG